VTELLAGFDAGQTHTRCRLTRAGGGPMLAEGLGPGVCHLAAPEGPERFAAALRESLSRARAQLHDRRDPAGGAPLRAAAVGASGIEQGTPVQRQGLAIAAVALGLPPERLAVTGDERTALRGAFPDGPGVLVISGTGTIALGRNGLGPEGPGREHRCAGWGWLLDGAGSAMDIGRDGLALSLRMADGRQAASPLLERLWRGLDLDPADPLAPQSIKARVVDPAFGPAGFARLAPLIDDLAAAGEAHAAAILDRHGDALAEMVAAVAGALDLAAPPVCGLGGALTHLEGLGRAFRARLAERLPGARLVPPAGDACAGALAMAAAL
jgi:glucosamine kinase